MRRKRSYKRSYASLVDSSAPRTKCRARLTLHQDSAAAVALNEGAYELHVCRRRIMASTIAAKKQPLKLIPHPRVGHLLAPRR